MAKEIERKFKVTNTSYRDMATGARRIRQAYISDRPGATVRIRISDSKAYITVKGITRGCERDEWEYAIPERDAEEMANALASGFAIDKTRYIVEYCGYTWEVDEFHGRHEGLVIAEVELPSSEVNPPLPSFIGEEVTGDPRYYNSELAKH